MCEKCERVRTAGYEDNDYCLLNEHLLGQEGVLAVETHPGKEFISLTGWRASAIAMLVLDLEIEMEASFWWVFLPARIKTKLKRARDATKVLDIVA